MIDYRMEIIRNDIPIGLLLCKSVSIKFDAKAEVMRGMQVNLYADRYDMTEVTQKVRDWIYFDGTRYFDGTWSFWNTIYETSTFTFDMFTDRLRPVLIRDGVETPLGKFMIIAAPETLSETGNYYNLEAYDETMLLKQAALTARKFYAEGTNYLTAIENLLTECGFGNILADANTATMQISREFAVGTTYLEIINSLLEEINYNPVHTDANGYVILTRKANKSTADFVYRDRSTFKLLGTIERDTDIYEKPNVLIGVISNPQTEPTVYTRENNDPTSILSIYRRGYRVTRVYRMSNMASEAELEAYIDAQLLNSMQTTETVNFETLAEAGHEFGNTVQLATDLIDGLYVETGYQIDVSVNKARMRHTGERRVFV